MLVQKALVLAAAVSAVVLGSWGWQAPAQAAQHQQANKGGGSGNVTLRIAGEEGTPFSGACSIGGEEHDISGHVPRSFGYDLDNQKLECEIAKQGDESGELKVVLSSEDARSVQRVEGGDVTLRLTYANGSVSSSTTSSSSQVSSSSSFSQTVISGSNSSASGANGDARGGDDAASLAERIIERVFKEVGLKN